MATGKLGAICEESAHEIDGCFQGYTALSKSLFRNSREWTVNTFVANNERAKFIKQDAQTVTHGPCQPSTIADLFSATSYLKTSRHTSTSSLALVICTKCNRKILPVSHTSQPFPPVIVDE